MVPGNSSANKVKVAIIDDEEELVKTVQEFLGVRGFEVVYALGGRSGLELVKQEKPNLIVLDVTMPDLDGRDVLVRLKKDKHTRDIPVIMLTGRDCQLDKEYGIELGAYAYLAKPYNGQDLLKEINYILEKIKKEDSGK